jgi:hypothetical protein
MNKFLRSDNASIENVSRAGLVISRVTIGFLWFAQLFWKLPPTFGCPPGFAVTTNISARSTGLCDWVGIMTLYSRWPLQAFLVKSLVVPNMAWMGWIIFLMEAFVAVSLILGLFTRLGGLAALLQAVNLYIGVSAAPGEWPWTYIMLSILGLIFLAIPAGRILGPGCMVAPASSGWSGAGKSAGENPVIPDLIPKGKMTLSGRLYHAVTSSSRKIFSPARSATFNRFSAGVNGHDHCSL